MDIGNVSLASGIYIRIAELCHTKVIDQPLVFAPSATTTIQNKYTKCKTLQIRHRFCLHIYVDTTPPTRLYKGDDKNLRNRIFPCVGCGEGADGSHQCGICFAHCHVMYGTPYPGLSKGFGQPVLCGKCSKTPTPNLNNPPPPPDSYDKFMQPCTITSNKSSAPGGWTMHNDYNTTVTLDVTDRSMSYHYVRRLRHTSQKVSHYYFVFN